MQDSCTKYLQCNKHKKNMIKGDEVIIIQGHIHDICVHRIYYESGSSIEVMCEHCFSKLPEAMKKLLRQPDSYLTSFLRHSV